MSNSKHHGPHCAGICEGQAYTIMLRQKDTDIEQLQAENAALKADNALAFWILPNGDQTGLPPSTWKT